MSDLPQQLDEWQDYVTDEKLRLVLASAAAELRKRKRKRKLPMLKALIIFLLLVLCLNSCDTHDNVRDIKLLLKASHLSFSEVEKRKLEDLDAAIAVAKVPR